MAANFLNSLFLISTANVSSRQPEAETVDMFIYHPSNLSMRWCIYILILTAVIRIEYWSYTQYVQLHLNPVLVPLQLHKDKPSFQAARQFARQNPIFTRWKPSATEVQCSLCLSFTQWLCWWNACRASTTISLTWNDKETHQHQEIPNESKPKKEKSKIYRLIFFFPHQLTVNRTHDDPCSASLGYFLTKNDCRHLKHYNAHQKKQIPWFYIVPRFQNHSKNMKSMERTHSTDHYCPTCDMSVIWTFFVTRRNVWE